MEQVWAGLEGMVLENSNVPNGSCVYFSSLVLQTIIVTNREMTARAGDIIILFYFNKFLQL